MTTTETDRTAGKLPLGGVRVLDLTHVWSGPMATRVLTGLGAEMIKLESPQRPDMLRGPGSSDLPLRYPDLDHGADPYNRNAWFNTQNTGKRDVVLDLKDREGLALARRLVAVSDLVIANYRPGVLDRMGLGFEALRQIKPDIVLVEMPGYAAGTPQASAPAFGAQFDANSGSATLTGDDECPLLTGYALGDPAAGLFAAAAAVSALVKHRRTGNGGHVILPQSESMMPLLGEYYLAESAGEPIVEGLNADRRCVPHGIYRTGDDRWIAIAVQDDAQWQTFAQRLHDTDPGIGSRFPTVTDRRAHADAIEKTISAWAASISDPTTTARSLQADGVPSAP
ncbi:MAG: CaiB/BaiF CoA transferase family protein, partial [Haloechinothrix sp.]